MRTCGVGVRNVVAGFHQPKGSGRWPYRTATSVAAVANVTPWPAVSVLVITWQESINA